MAFKAISHEFSTTKKLSDINFSIWKRTIRYILHQDKVEYVIDSPLSLPKENASTTIRRNNENTQFFIIMHM